MDSLQVDVDVNEAYIGRLTPNMAAEAVLDAYPDLRVPAHVIAIVPAADRGKATVKVRVALENKDSRIVPHMGVPSQAIVKRGGANTIFIVDDGKVRVQRVTSGVKRSDDKWLIPSGVATGDQLVMSPPEVLRDGMSVNVEGK